MEKRGHYIRSPEHREKMRLLNLGKKQSEITIEKERAKRIGQKHSDETKKKIGEKHKGKILSKKTKLKISKNRKGITGMDKNPNWKGGKSFEVYPVDWTKTLKRAIRERDGYVCKNCGKFPATDCHHIDYDKKNCEITNLITLCRSCHAKTNFNRKNWQEKFNLIIKN